MGDTAKLTGGAAKDYQRAAETISANINTMRATIEQQAASFAAKDKEITALHERCNALDQEHKTNAVFISDLQRRIAETKSRAEQAERALAVLAPVRDMLILCDELGGIQPGEGMAGYLRRLIDEVASKECERAFVAQHGSDSREGK